MPEAELEQELLSIKASSHPDCQLLFGICLGAILYLSIVLGLTEPFDNSLHLCLPAECSCCKGSNSVQQICQHVTAVQCAFGDPGSCSTPALCASLTSCPPACAAGPQLEPHAAVRHRHAPCRADGQRQGHLRAPLCDWQDPGDPGLSCYWLGIVCLQHQRSACTAQHLHLHGRSAIEYS